MNLTQLNYFKTVCTFRSVSAAAEHLYISQPSLSNAIKELEKEFGVALFKRHHHGMELTPEGAELLKLSTNLLNHASNLQRTMNDLGEKRKILRLGIPPMISSLLLPYIYNDFLPAHPEIQLDITEGGRQELADKLSDDFLDMVFLPHNQPFEKSFECMPITKLETVCCAFKDNPVSKYSSVTPVNLKDIPIVLFKNSFFHAEEIKKWFATSGIEPEVLLQTDQLSTLQNVIANNIATGFLFRQLIEPDSNLVPIPMESPIQVNISLVWKKNSCFLSSMSLFREYIKIKNPFKFQA